MAPRYSYLAALPCRAPVAASEMAAPDPPNFFTFGFSHGRCMDENFVRISGEDHFSALKSPRAEERCGRLAEWVWEKCPYLEPATDFPARYGSYSETADFMPLVGTTMDTSPCLLHVRVHCMGAGFALRRRSHGACASWLPRFHRPSVTRGEAFLHPLFQRQGDGRSIKSALLQRCSTRPSALSTFSPRLRPLACTASISEATRSPAMLEI